MKKRMLTIIIGIVVIVALILVGWYVMFVHFNVGPAFPFLKVDAVEYLRTSGETSEAEPLIALTNSEETAKEIAEQYGITFVAFEKGVATFYTDEDLNQVIKRGEENGYPALYINYARELSD